MCADTYSKQSQDDNDWGNTLLQKPHAEQGQQQRNKTRNQSIQVVLQGSNLYRLQGHAGGELLDSSLDALAAGRELIPLTSIDGLPSIFPSNITPPANKKIVPKISSLYNKHIRLL